MDASKVLEILESMSFRQQQVLERIFQGKKDGEIARELVISEETVRKHLVEIYKKFSIKVEKKLMRQKLHLFIIEHQQVFSVFFSSQQDRELLQQIIYILAKIDKDQKQFLKKFLSDIKDSEIKTKLANLIAATSKKILAS